MYVRKRKNKSGTTSVFIAASKREPGRKNPKTIMVKSFGSSADPKKISKLKKDNELDNYVKSKSEPNIY